MTGRGPWTGESHMCPARGCSEAVDRLMCRAHWALVSRGLQAEAWQAWDSGRGVHSIGYQRALREAIDAAGTVLAAAC
jgi:hypothetical protein